MTIEKVHISEIKVGDTIVCSDGSVRTVCARNIKKDPFMGMSLYGSTYTSGREKVDRVVSF